MWDCWKRKQRDRYANAAIEVSTDIGIDSLQDDEYTGVGLVKISNIFGMRDDFSLGVVWIDTAQSIVGSNAGLYTAGNIWTC